MSRPSSIVRPSAIFGAAAVFGVFCAFCAFAGPADAEDAGRLVILPIGVFSGEEADAARTAAPALASAWEKAFEIAPAGVPVRWRAGNGSEGTVTGGPAVSDPRGLGRKCQPFWAEGSFFLPKRGSLRKWTRGGVVCGGDGVWIDGERN